MIKGIKYWDGVPVDGKKINIRYEQTHNAVESIIKKALHENEIDRGFLESCGASSFCTIMEGMGYLDPKEYMRFPTGETIQMDDAIMIYMNDPRNNDKFSRGHLFDNRAAKNYPMLAKVLYNVEAELKFYQSRSVYVDDIIQSLDYGHGVQVCMITPGHWIAIIAYDKETEEFIYHDSWGGRPYGIPKLKNGGNYERVSIDEMSNFMMLAVHYR